MVEGVVLEYARVMVVEMMNRVGRGPEEEETELLNIFVQMDYQNMEVTVMQGGILAGSLGSRLPQNQSNSQEILAVTPSFYISSGIVVWFYCQ
jgi:hypothetical protein